MPTIHHRGAPVKPFCAIRANVPTELLDRAQWVTWKYERRSDEKKPTKVLYNSATGARADSTEPRTWGTFDDAGRAYERGGYNGLGFVVTEDDPYCGVDIDNCIVDGRLTDDANRWLLLLNSYTEVTPSNNGLRVWVRAVKCGDRCKNSKLGVEVYDDKRFFTVTGNHYPGTPTTIKSRQKELTALYDELFPKEKSTPGQRAIKPAATDAIPQDDQGLLKKMFNARNGAAICALWQGDKRGHVGPDGQPDDSAADLALCNHLAFWTGCDAQRMDRLFRQSGLMRPKWDRRARQGETYGQGTIARAIAGCRQTYDPTRRRVDDRGGNGSAPKVDVQATINRSRQWIRTHSFLPFIAPELLPESGLRNEPTLRRVADAVLDLFEEYGSLSGFLSLREIRRRAGVGKDTVRRAMARLMPWFVALTDHEQNANEGAALHYVLTFRVIETVCLPQDVDRGDCLNNAKSPFTLHKAHDAFTIGGNRDMRNAALFYVIGRPAVDVLIQLEGYDRPRRAAWADYRAAQKGAAHKGEAITSEDVAALLRLADGLVDEPLPVTLAALTHLGDYAAGVKTLSDLGVIHWCGDTVFLLPDYAGALNPLVASLGPTALLMIDASVEHGDLTYDEFAQHIGLKYGTLHRAMGKLLKRGIYSADRDGMTKRFTLRCDWLSEVEAQSHTMRTYGLGRKREIADAEEVYQYAGQQMASSPPDQQPKLVRRQERAFNRLHAAMALDEPTLANDLDFARALRTHLETKRSPKQAPAMPEPGRLAWDRWFTLGNKAKSNGGLLNADDLGEFNGLTVVLPGAAAYVQAVQWDGAA